MNNTSTPDVRVLLRLEGLIVLLVSLMLYSGFGEGWVLFGVLFLAPDLSMLGYLAGPRVGAISYNAAHTYAASGALAGFGLALASPLAVALALIWTAHIGFDRAMGYGLKSPSGFHTTHLGQIGRRDAVQTTD